MPWSNAVACFFGGLFFANFFPHFISGMSGAPFPTPFAKPPFRGLSSPIVNMLYGLLNLSVAYLLLVVAGSFSVPAAAAAGFGLFSMFISRSVTKLKAGG